MLLGAAVQIAANDKPEATSIQYRTMVELYSL